jgi:hypothetical protein
MKTSVLAKIAPARDIIERCKRNEWFAVQHALPSLYDELTKVSDFNIQRWSAQGLEFFAISDINAEELQELVEKFEAAFHSASGT